MQPSCFASANFFGLRSTPTIGWAPTAFAAWITAKPTAPSPKTATDEKGSTLALFQTAPRPVATPQPKRHAFSSANVGSIFAHEISASTVYSAKVEHPMKWKICEPSRLSVKRVVPSGISPFPCEPRICGHRLVFGLMQKMHDGALHCGVYPGTTWSPTCTDVTPSPIASTTAPASWPRIDGKSPSGSEPPSV